ncbi:MAG: tetratricopeptide repeat protein [Kofleriaceae bacterium]
MRSLARRHRLAEAWDELAQTLRRILDAGELHDAIDEQETIDLYAQLGELEGDLRGHVDEAIDAWGAVIRIDPSDLRALAALEDLFVREGRWADSVEVLEKRALVLDDELERRETLLQAAAIREDRLGDSTRAAELYDRLWRADPTDRLASERLEAIYRHQGRWAELADVLLERSESATGLASQLQILHEVATIYEDELGDPESAFYVLQAAFNRDGSDEHTVSELERLAGITTRWHELLDEYGKRATELEQDDRSAAAVLWVKIGHGYREQLARLDDALHAVQQALRLDPRHGGALAEVADLQRSRGDWNELGETLQRQAALEPTREKKAALYLELAESIERDTADLAGAVRSYQEVLVHEPGSRAALDALDRLYRHAQAWEPLVEILARRAELSTDELEVVRLQLEIGSIWEQRVADAGQAIAAYRKVLELEPSNPAALRALEGLYERSEQHDKYLEVLAAQLDASHSGADRLSIFERMAVAWEERLGDLDRAAEAYEHMLAIDPHSSATYHLLARLYRQAGKHEALVETYRGHIAATSDVMARVELYVAMGQVYETSLDAVDPAIEAYNHALALDPGEARALEGLARVYDLVGAWDHAIDVLARLVELSEDPRKVELFGRMARIQATELGDAEGAEANRLRGLALAPGHLPTMEALTAQYEQRGDWHKAAQMLRRAETHVTLAIDKVRRLFAAANIYLRELRDELQAKQLYAAVIALDPEHVDAGRPLAELYFGAGEWAALSPVIEMLCRKVGQRSADLEERRELYCRAARCADELGDLAKALGHYQAAYELDPSHLPTLIGRADLLFKSRDWDRASKLYQTILIEHRDGQDDASVVQTYCRLGAIRQALGDRKQALGMFGKALELDPLHRDALQAVVELQTQHGAWEAVVRAKRALMATADDPERTQLLAEIAALQHDRLHDAHEAAKAYTEALELAPENRQLLQKLLDLCIDAKQWKMALEVIQRFVGLESDPFHRGVYLHAAATLCRDELVALDDAVDYYDCALDSFFSQPERLDDQQLPRALKSFEAIDKVLTTKRDWKAQERAYRDMINRLPKDGGEPFYKLQVGLVDGLAEIYRTRLKQLGEATAAFEIAQQMDPDNKLRHDGADRAEILAELYVMAGADHADKAIAQHTRMLRREPFKYDSYKTLARLYKDTQQYDKHWCVCNALKFLRKADADELQFCDQYKPRGLVKAKHVMSPASWAKLAHPDENRYISAVFGACWQGVAAMKAFPHKAFELKREDRRQLEGDPLMFSKLFLYLAQVLNVSLPEVYLLDDHKSVEIQLANATDRNELCPSFVVRPHTLQGKTEREIAFALTRRLAFMRPEYYLRMLLPTNTELKVALLSAIVMLQPSFPVPPNMVAPVQDYLPEMRKRMTPHALEQLAAVIQRFIQVTPEINLAKWGFAVDAAAHRAGFVMCGDLEVSARLVAAEPVVVDGPTIKDKVRELVLFSISEEYFAIRTQMELTIGGS